MNLVEKEKYLLKASYDFKDVMALAECKKTKAYEVMEACRKRYRGSIPGRPGAITARSYWEYQGTTIEQEIRLLRMLKGEVR